MLQPANTTTTLAGYSWQALKQFIVTYGKENGADFDACISSIEAGVVCTNVLNYAEHIEKCSASFTVEQAVQFLYAHCVSMLDIYTPVNSRRQAINAAYRVMLSKIVPPVYALVPPVTLYDRLRKLKKACSSDEVTQMNTYSRALATMQTGRKYPRRNTKVKTERIIIEAFHELSRSLVLQPTPAMLQFDERRRAAWFAVLAACLPGTLCKEPEIDKKIA